jgi:hypothetical protein
MQIDSTEEYEKHLQPADFIDIGYNLLRTGSYRIKGGDRVTKMVRMVAN